MKSEEIKINIIQSDLYLLINSSNLSPAGGLVLR